jgi:hypothetical protein
MKSIGGHLALLRQSEIYCDGCHHLNDLKVPVELVLVPVTVQDKDGKLIYGLQKEDFKVYEEGMPERITYFSVEPSPLSVAVLVDQTMIIAPKRSSDKICWP